VKFKKLIATTAATLAALTALMGHAAHAANHALVMWISDYDDRAFPNAARSPDLPGVRLDGASAKRIAAALGVPSQNIVEFSDDQLSLYGMRRALDAFAMRVQPGDKAFVYYAGHGTQARTGDGCSEGLLTYDNKVLWQAQFDAALQSIATRASQLVVMNDSCFSGGASTARASRGPTGRTLTPRSYPYPASFRPETKDVAGYKCGVPINASRAARSVGSQMLYIASAAATEVAWESSTGGGMGTNAWLQCLSASASDRDRSGSISGEELRDCAQKNLDPEFRDDPLSRQRVTLQGNERLPVAFTDGLPGSSETPVLAALALQDLKEGSNSNVRVDLRLPRTSFRIGADLLDFAVTSSQRGYLYLVHVKPDGQTFQVLFPNSIDSNNQVEADREYRFPRETWRLRSQGPEGTGHLLAIVSESQRDFARHLVRSGPFATAPTNAQGTKRLAVEAGAGYGASDVIPVREMR